MITKNQEHRGTVVPAYPAIQSSKNKKLQIRNSTAEFLIFTKQENKNTIEVRIEDETVWLTQKLMSVLFEVSIPTINEHLANIFKTGEVSEVATVRKFRIVQTEGTRQVNREVEFYGADDVEEFSAWENYKNRRIYCQELSRRKRD